MRIFLILSFCIVCGPTCAKSQKEIKTVTLSADTVAGDSLFENIPPATVECIFGGNLAKVFPGRHKFISSENAILIDGDSRKLAVREIIITDDKKSNGEVDMYIEVSDVTNQDLINLLVLKKTVRTKSAKIDLVLKKETEKGQTVVKTNFKGEGENPTPAILFAKIRKVSSTKFNDQDYYLVTGEMKIRLSESLQGDGEDSELSGSLSEDHTGVMHCIFEKCPVVQTNLERLKETFGIEISEEDLFERLLIKKQ